MTVDPAAGGPTENAPRSSTGLPANLAAALAYTFGAISGMILLFAERRSREVRFHAAQSLVVFATLWIVLIILSAVLFPVLPFSLWGLTKALINLLVLGMVGLWIFLVVSAFQGKHPKLPLVGDLAEKMADNDD